MTTIHEQLSPPPRGDDAARATNILVRAGAQFVDEALIDNPNGPVQMHTELSRTDVRYEVTIGDRASRCIWHRTVMFGHTDRTVAGGAALIEAARMQESVAWAARDLLDGGATRIRPEDLTHEMLAGYFGEHCECRPLNIERTSHSHDCNDDHCEDVSVALGGRPPGCGYRSTGEALSHMQEAKRRICADIIEEGRNTARLAALGKHLLDEAARFKSDQEP